MNEDKDSSSQGPSSPNTGRDKKETLVERAARVIGRPLEDVHIDGDTSTTGSSGRRQQVLQAQRIHRLRTQQYIRELEREVFRLRDVEKELRNQLEEFRTQMRSSDIQPQIQTLPEVAFEAQEIISTTPMHAPTVDLTGIADVPSIGSCTVHPAQIPSQEYIPTPPRQFPRAVKLASLNSQAAVNFILTLEKPCLPHIKHAHFRPADEPPRTDIEFHSGPGHLLTLSSSLLHDHRFDDPDTRLFSVPEADLERLLQTSLELPLTNEATPVQIWNRIKQLSTSFAVSEDILYALRTEFERYVHCNSFGAVVEDDIVNAIISSITGQ